VLTSKQEFTETRKLFRTKWTSGLDSKILFGFFGEISLGVELQGTRRNE